jgi:hypothetical protein
LASITSDLTITIINRVPQLYRNDGTYLLWALTNNIYRSNIAFVETIREKITNATLIQHNHDIEKYLIFIKNNLRMITTKSSSGDQHMGLITYILRQLKQTQNQIFLRYIQDLHVQYQEAKLPGYTPTKLIQDVEDKIRVLKHAEVWENQSHHDTPAMALNTVPVFDTRLKEFLAHHITTELKRLTEGSKTSGNDGKDGKFRPKFQHQEWMFIPPSNPSDIKTVQGKNYQWCAKCNKGSGQWVQAHTTETHLDNFKPTPRRSENNRKHGILKNPITTQQGEKNHRVSFAAGVPPPELQQHDSAQLSLAEGLTNCFRFDVQELNDSD